MSDGVKVRILGDDSDLQSKLKGAGIAVAKWAAASVLAATAAGIAMTKSGLDSADALAKQAQQLNTTSKDLATLRRASEMAGVSQEKMAVASRTLTTRLAQAATGTGTAVDALKRLGIETDELERMSLSDRIKTLNQALNENVSANERAAIAVSLYGENAGLAVSQISASTIETATEQVRAFGAALSEVEAAQIENANDTMSQMGLLTQSVTQRLAHQFAPVLDAVAGKLFDAAKEADGFKESIDSAFSGVVWASGQVANAIAKVQIAVKGGELAFDGLNAMVASRTESMMAALEDAKNKILRDFNQIIRGANSIPGVNIAEIVIGESESMTKIKKWSDTAKKEFEITAGEFVSLMNAPLPSDSLDLWIKDAQDASQAAAEAAVKAREAITIPPIDDPESSPTKTDEVAKEAAQRNLEAVRNYLKSEEQLRWDAEDAAYQALIDARDLQLITKSEYLEREAELTQKYIDEDLRRAQEKADKELAIQTAAARAKHAVMSGSLNNLASLMDTKSRKLFEIGKAAALAQATIDGYASIQKAYYGGLAASSGNIAVGAAYAATAAVATGVQISKIASTSFGGGGGGTSAPSGGSAPSGESTAAQNAGRAEAAQSVNLSLQGETFSRQSVESLIEELNEAVANGARIRVS